MERTINETAEGKASRYDCLENDEGSLFFRQVEDAVVVKSMTVQEMIKEYLDRVMDEMQMDIPNVDYLESISEDLLETAETLQSL